MKAALVAAKYAVDAPNDPQAKAKLKHATEQLKDVLGSLESALENKDPAPKEKQDLDRKLAALAAALPKLEKGVYQSAKFRNHAKRKYFHSFVNDAKNGIFLRYLVNGRIFFVCHVLT